MHEAIKVYPDGREVCTDTVAGRREYADRLREMCRRQGWKCAICDRIMGEPTFDHEIPRGMGGANRTDALTHEDGRWRNAAVCYGCNGQKGSRRFEWRDSKYQQIQRFQEAA